MAMNPKMDRKPPFDDLPIITDITSEHHPNQLEDSSFNLNQWLLKHPRVSVKQRLTCNACKEVFEMNISPKKYLLANDNKTISETLFPTCEKCKVALPTRDDLNEQVTSDSNLSFQFIPKPCNRVFKHNHRLGEYVLTHKVDSSLNQWPKRFTQKSSLAKHMLTHKSNPDLRLRFSCQQCPKRFTKNSNLKRHMLTHHEPNSSLRQLFKCNQCQRGFTQKSNLTRHTFTHKPNPVLRRRFPCEICQQQFTQESNLKRHMLAIHKSRQEGNNFGTAFQETHVDSEI